MSKYTTEVRFICESLAGQTVSVGQSSIDNIITTAAPLLFNFDFPIFDTNYRLVLEKKILRHYYTREISEETVGLWKLRLEDRLNMIMPYYNKLYESETLKFNPLYDVDLSSEHTTKNDGQSINTNVRDNTETTNESGDNNRNSISNLARKNAETVVDDVDGTNWEYYSDTPQGAVTRIDVASNNYLTNATKNTTDTTDTKTTNGNQNEQEINADYQKYKNDTERSSTQTDKGQNIISNTESYVESVVGKRGHHTYSAMIMEYRKSLLNIDAMIVEDLSDLFFGLW